MILNFPPGDYSDAVGRVMGPDQFGAMYEVTDWEPGAVLHLKPIVPTDERSVYADVFNEARVTDA